MQMKKPIVALALSAALLPALAQAQTAPAQAQTAEVDVGEGVSVDVRREGPLKVAFFSEGANNSAMQASIDGARRAAQELGWEIDVFDGKFDAVTQLNQLQNALNRDYDAWVLKAVEGNTMCNIATKDAPEKGILVVVSVLAICGRGANEGNALWSPGTLAYIGGAETPKAFFEVLDRMGRENPGPQKLGVFTGPELNPITKNHEAALKMFRAKYPAVEVVAVARTDYSTPSALEKAGPMVQANRDMTLYYTAFSNLAKGLAPVLEQAGLAGKVKIYDNGATAWAIGAIKDGTIAASSANRLGSNAYSAVKAIDRARKGETLSRAIGDLGLPLVEGKPPTNPYLIDAANLATYQPEVEVMDAVGISDTSRGTTPLLSLAGRRALVTGGAGGIGAAIVERFHQLGARVGFIDIAAPQDGAGTGRAFAKADITDEGEVEAAFAILAERLAGPFDILVNCAAIAGSGRPTHLATVQDFDRVFAVNVKGAFLCSRAFVRDRLARHEPGTIVNVSSINGVIGNADIPLYHAAKAAMQLLSKCDAVTYADRGIRVNCVLPGSTRTDLTLRAQAESDDPETYVGNLVRAHPLGRQARPEEIADVVAFLASDSSAFMTGAELAADGGYTAQ